MVQSDGGHKPGASNSAGTEAQSVGGDAIGSSGSSISNSGGKATLTEATQLLEPTQPTQSGGGGAAQGE